MFGTYIRCNDLRFVRERKDVARVSVKDFFARPTVLRQVRDLLVNEVRTHKLEEKRTRFVTLNFCIKIDIQNTCIHAILYYILCTLYSMS